MDDVGWVVEPACIIAASRGMFGLDKDRDNDKASNLSAGDNRHIWQGQT